MELGFWCRIQNSASHACYVTGSVVVVLFGVEFVPTPQAGAPAGARWHI